MMSESNYKIGSSTAPWDDVGNIGTAKYTVYDKDYKQAYTCEVSVAFDEDLKQWRVIDLKQYSGKF